jgi:site-specific DNA recombinase
MATRSIPAVAYYRMSDDKQEASIPAQREAVEKLAATRDYAIVREYRDEGISGDDTERRAGFKQMLADAGAGDFAAVLCWDQDRFGRFDPLEAGYWIKPLRDCGIWLETVAQGRIDWNNFAGRILYTVQQEGKHAYLLDMSRNVTRGMLKRAQLGEWLGGRPPYGYRLTEHKRLEPGDPAEIEIVRWLFREYLGRDVGLTGLADELNARGVPSPGRKGKLWSAATIRLMLIRPTYLGHTVWNRWHSGSYHGVRNGEITTTSKPKGRRRRNDPKEWVILENTHPALIDAATFERVQQKLTARREGHSSPVRGTPFLLTGLLKCGECGWPMYGMTRKSTGRRIYTCGQYHIYRRSGCRSNSVVESDVVAVILATLEEVFLAPKNLAALKAEIRRQEAAERAGRAKPEADLSRRIAALTKKIDAGLERWLSAPAGLIDAAGAKLEQWRKERETLEEQRRAIAKPADTVAALDAVAEHVAAGVATLREQAAGAAPEVLREVLRSMLEKVVVEFRHVPYGKLTRSIATGGNLYLRSDQICCKPVNLGWPGLWCSR